MTALCVQAQSIFGTITGTVNDSTGAVIPNSSVTLKNSDSGDVRRSSTNADGYFSFSSVPAGHYDLTIESAGFQRSITKGIELLGSSNLNFPVRLEVGTSKTEVEVTIQADQIIPVDSGEKSVVLTQKQLQDYTIVGANAAEFIKILPGFAVRNNGDPTKTGTDFKGDIIGINGNGDGGSQSPLNGAFVANGTGVNNIDITADGAHVSDPGCNCATPVNPNTDMIQEFKVLTSNFNAENSKGPIVINSIAKSGGRDFHGEGYFNARNYAMNANTWSNNSTGTARPESKFYYPGGNIGGPVLIPGTDFNKNRDKLFFFTGFEYYYQTLDTGLLAASVPTANMRNGNFSPAELATLGATNTGAGASQITNKNYPGGIIPSSALNPSGQALLNLYPMPNANPASSQGNNYLEDEIFNQNSLQWLTRVDYSISDNTKLFVRYNLQSERQQFPVTLWWRNPTSVPYPTPIIGNNDSQSVSTSLTHVFNPTMSNEFVFGYTYINFPNVFNDPKKVSRSALNIPFTGLYKNGVEQIPSLTSWSGEMATILNPSGFQVGGSEGLFAKKYLPSFSDNLSKVWGTHTAKFGFYYEHVINNQPSSNYANGLMANATWATNSGNPYADLLTGYAGQYQETNYDRLNNEAYNSIEFFGQDSWKVTKRLTVDVGLRVSHLGPWTDREGLGFATFNPALYNPDATATSGTGFSWHARDKSVPLSGFPSRALYWGPRFGLAYDVFGTGKTVIRGGWGQFYYHNAQFTQGLGQAQGIQTATLSGPISFAQIEATNPATQPFGTGAVDRHDDHTPLTTSYSFTISQRLPFASLVEVSYVGNQNKDQLNTSGVGTQVNLVPAGTLWSTGKDPNSIGGGFYSYGPYPIYQSINVANHNLYSNYNALQVSWVRQKGKYDITLNYTYSKALGITTAGDNFNLNNDYGAEPFDRRHIFNAAYSVELPSPVKGNKALGGVVNGWQISGLTQVQSGVNLTGTSTNGNFNLTNQGGANQVNADNGFANSAATNYSVLGTGSLNLNPIITCNPTQNLKPQQYINGNCFAIPTQLGQNGPTVLPEYFGPWFVNSDLSLFKNFQLSETRKLQFRFSAYNFLNHPVWSFSNSGLGSNSLLLDIGEKSGQQNLANAGFGNALIKQGNRLIQLSVKFYF